MSSNSEDVLLPYFKNNKTQDIYTYARILQQQLRTNKNQQCTTQHASWKTLHSKKIFSNDIFQNFCLPQQWHDRLENSVSNVAVEGSSKAITDNRIDGRATYQICSISRARPHDTELVELIIILSALLMFCFMRKIRHLQDH